MSDEAAFLKAIADQPAERATRFAYADWLDENGRAAEAEFLKLQLQVAEANARLIELGGQLGAGWLTAVGNVRESQEIKLHSGRAIHLQNLRQWNFNGGWLEGGPTSQQNRESVQRLVAEEELRRGELPYLIQPIERPSKAGRHLLNRGPRGWLPEVACVAEFDSLQPAKDKSRDGSQLTIIWFQHEFVFPIDPGVREQIRAIDWEKHAHDFDW